MKSTSTPHHGWELPAVESLWTVASFVTIVRTFIAAGFAVAAAVYHDQALLLVALCSYWVGDILDGIVARARDEEMRSGAVLDIMADRLCVSLIYLVYGFMHLDMMPAIGLYLVEFMFIDGFLSLSFLFWPLLSPNYFYLIDKRIFQLNWSPIGKVANSSFFLLATVLVGSPGLSIAIVFAVVAIKIYSLIRLYKIGLPSSI